MYFPLVYKYAVFTLSSAVLEKEKLGCFQAVGLHRRSQSFSQTWLKRLLLAPCLGAFRLLFGAFYDVNYTFGVTRRRPSIMAPPFLRVSAIAGCLSLLLSAAKR